VRLSVRNKTFWKTGKIMIFLSREYMDMYMLIAIETIKMGRSESKFEDNIKNDLRETSFEI
jgi:hypothetical protein